MALSRSAGDVRAPAGPVTLLGNGIKGALGAEGMLVGVSFSMLMYYNEHTMRLKVYRKSNLPPSWA